MSINMAVRTGKILALCGFFAGVVMVKVALGSDTVSIPGVPDDFGKWPVISIMGFICLAIIGMASACVFKAMSIAAPLSALQTQGFEIVRRLDEIAAKQGDAKAKPCAMETATFREELRNLLQEAVGK